MNSNTSFFNCELGNHLNVPLNLFCVSEECKSNCLICCYCLLENHASHVNDCCKLDDFIEKIKKITEENPFKCEELKEKSRKNFEDLLEKLEKEKNQLIALLDEEIEKINDFFEGKKKTILQRFESIKTKLKDLQKNVEIIEKEINLKNETILKSMMKENYELLSDYKKSITDLRTNEIDINEKEISLKENHNNHAKAKIKQFHEDISFMMENPLISITFNKDFQEILQSNLEINISSHSFDKDSYINLILSWLKKQNSQPKLIYKGSINGFKQENFLASCLGKKNCFSIIESDHGKYFGAFTKIAFHKNYNFENDKNCFIFSLSNKTIHSLIDSGTALFGINGLHRGKKLLYCLGQTGGICIFEDCNKHSENYVDFSSMNKSDKEDSEEKLAGAGKFRVIDFEVYEVEE